MITASIAKPALKLVQLTNISSFYYHYNHNKQPHKERENSIESEMHLLHAFPWPLLR